MINIKLEAMKKKIRELLYDTDLKTDEIESLTKELLDLYNVIDCDSPVKTVAFIETKEGINVYYKGEQVLKNGTNEDVNKLNLHNR
tara:strand:+ start:644 stop:901 length:258 start_codon:yes stop_codon:yes gene_type:complete